MRFPILLAATALCSAPLLASCGGNESDARLEQDAQSQEEGQDALTSSYDFKVPAGKHEGFLEGGVRDVHLGVHVDRTLHFQAQFQNDVPYTTSSPGDQTDWNKLMGLTTNRIHETSIRLGWAWNPKTSLVDLGFYGYVDGNRISQPLTSVPLMQWADVTIHMDNGGMSVTVNGNTKSVRQSLDFSSWIPTTSWVLLTCYFGGNETAPHDIHVDVQDVSSN